MVKHAVSTAQQSHKTSAITQRQSKRIEEISTTSLETSRVRIQKLTAKGLNHGLENLR